MKPPPFTYHRPQTIDEALAVLAEVGSDGKVLAGGQSLVPVLNMRLAAPAHLVDINRLFDLSYVSLEEHNGTAGVRVGAVARHADVEHDPAAQRAIPLLHQALTHVAHPTIRNRGTTVGSLAHADPCGEMTGVLALLGGSVELRRQGGRRVVSAEEFFVGPLECCAAPDELVTSAFFPRPAGRTGSAWVEMARRHGDYALAGVGALVTVDDDRRIAHARAGYIGVDIRPLVLDLTEAVAGNPFDAADWDAAGRLAHGQVSPEPDIHASAEYRKHLVRVLTARALRDAAIKAVDLDLTTNLATELEEEDR